MSTNPFRLLFIYLSLSLLVGAGVGLLSNLGVYYQLYLNGIETQGVVVKPTCEKHLEFIYSYELNGRHYEGVGQSGTGKYCKELRVGDPVQIFYLPTKPKISVSGNSKALFFNEMISVGLSAILFPLIVLLGYFLHRKKNGKGAGVELSK